VSWLIAEIENGEIWTQDTEERIGNEEKGIIRRMENIAE
jgi:hypothetical protein